jgi:hypothetical protein
VTEWLAEGYANPLALHGTMMVTVTTAKCRGTSKGTSERSYLEMLRKQAGLPPAPGKGIGAVVERKVPLLGPVVRLLRPTVIGIKRAVGILK